MRSADWTYPTNVHFGAGRARDLGAICAAAGITRPLLVTDSHMADRVPTERALEVLRTAGLGVALFSGVRTNPTEAHVSAGRVLLREGGHDGVVALGGGSALDCGKLIALPGDSIWEIAGPGLPVIAVPTTSGSGAEVARTATLIDPAGGTKRMLSHPALMPTAALCDPELTLDVPPQLTAGAGMDALTHCLEAYCAPRYHPMADGIAVEGIRLVKDYLARAYHDGDDIEARAGMMTAAILGGVASEKGLGAIHALSHPIGARHDTHHGLTNGVILPYVLDFNRESVYDRIERLADWLGLADGFSGFFDFILRLRRDLGVPHTLNRIGVVEDGFEALSRLAASDPAATGNPRFLQPEDAMELYHRAYDGRLG